MEELIKKLKQSYGREIADIQIVGKAEINIILVNEINAESFSQELQNHLVSAIDELEIIKINVVDTQGAIKDSFATNQ